MACSYIETILNCLSEDDQDLRCRILVELSELVDDEENLIRIEAIDMLSRILPFYSEDLLKKCEVV